MRRKLVGENSRAKLPFALRIADARPAWRFVWACFQLRSVHGDFTWHTKLCLHYCWLHHFCLRDSHHPSARACSGAKASSATKIETKRRSCQAKASQKHCLSSVAACSYFGSLACGRTASNFAALHCRLAQNSFEMAPLISGFTGRVMCVGSVGMADPSGGF